MSKNNTIPSRMKQASGGIFLIGLGLIWLLGLDFWPWILIVIAIDSGIETLASGGWRGLTSTSFWVIGLTILFFTDTFWPGILILFGLNTVGEALFKESKAESRQEKPKRKRTFATTDGELPDGFDDMGEEEIAIYYATQASDFDRQDNRSR